jgi:hypothetical protein
MPTVVENYITEFEAEKRFRAPALGLVSNKKLDPTAAIELRKKMLTASPQVRENLVKLLEDVGFQLDELYPPSKVVIRDSNIIEILATEGFTKDDIGMSTSANVLRIRCEEESLRKHNKQFAIALEKSPSGTLFLLVAKAKALEANATIKRFADDAEWKDEEEFKVAQAALGDTRVEDNFIKDALTASNAKDGTALADALRKLGLIGTRRSLLTIASYMRTPLNVERTRFARSVRLNAIAALKYNFPAALVLNDEGVTSQKDYDAAEKFVTQKLGYVFEGPAPEFFTNQPFPVPMPPRK